MKIIVHKLIFIYQPNTPGCGGHLQPGAWEGVWWVSPGWYSKVLLIIIITMGKYIQQIPGNIKKMNYRGSHYLRH